MIEQIIETINSDKLSSDDLELLNRTLTIKKLKGLGVQYGLEHHPDMKAKHILCSLAKKDILYLKWKID